MSDLFTQARESRDRALRTVEENRPDWVTAAVDAIRDIAREQATMTAADVWRRVPATDNPRAMGAAITQAKKAGIIEPSGLPPVSTERANARKMPRWASRLYRPANGWEAMNREKRAGTLARALLRAWTALDDRSLSASEWAASFDPETWAALGLILRLKSPPSDATVLRVIDILRDHERDGAA